VRESVIDEFWNDHPCGDQQVGGLDREHGGDHERFFAEYDAYRYQRERHILACLDALEVAGKRVLEIGLGEGADSEQLIRRGARWSGVDLTAESVERVRTRLQMRRLPYEDLRQGSVLDLPFADQVFDMVFAHGALHHVPDITRAEREIRRVLRPEGELVAMLYARWSLNYLLGIALLRRLAVLAASPLERAGLLRTGGMLAAHLDNARREGLFRYLRMRRFLHANTDGPRNPYSQVYDLRRVRRDFPDFRVARSYRRFMHAPPLPVTGWPGASVAGWHLWVHLRPRCDGQTGLVDPEGRPTSVAARP
jgi:SAM-dependent methyltransferase